MTEKRFPATPVTHYPNRASVLGMQGFGDCFGVLTFAKADSHKGFG